MKNYQELVKLQTFLERYRYLKLNGKVGEDTFGFSRYLNQVLYHSSAWKQVRRQVILRDNGCDLGIEDRPIQDKILIHHISPITLEDINNKDPKVLDPNNLITVSLGTHNAIHYGDESQLFIKFTERKPNDTCPWRSG